MIYEPWMLAAIDQGGYNGVDSRHIHAVAEELLSTDLTEIDQGTFEAACRRCGIDPKNFTQEDLRKLESLMSEI